MTDRVARGLWLASFLLVAATPAAAQRGTRWKAHDPDRPKPVQVTPGATVGAPPSDAVILFDGADLSAWTSADGGSPKWAVRDGYFETVPGAGMIQTRTGFGDAQLHIEWAAPVEPVGRGQDRGNSGVYLMGRYEVQVLDSYENVTYPDGQAAALYGQHPPLVNASRPPGQWQSYDIVFRRPRFATDGSVSSPARMTVFHNGVVVQDAATLWGPTNWLVYDPYGPHPDRLPLALQDHDHPVRFRNVWIRPLADPPEERDLATSRPSAHPSVSELDRWVGRYHAGGGIDVDVTRDGSELVARFFGRTFPLVAETPSRFTFPRTAGTVEFSVRGGTPHLAITIAEQQIEANRR